MGWSGVALCFWEAAPVESLAKSSFALRGDPAFPCPSIPNQNARLATWEAGACGLRSGSHGADQTAEWTRG